MNHLDLFSGIGGFALAASWVWGEDHNIVSFCEMDKFCQKVLNKHWPDVPICSDIKEYKHNGAIIDLLTGGFPCQPFSCAGKQRGTEDNRYLWTAMLRVIQEAKPKFIIGENVSNIENIDNGMVVYEIQSNLENIGYEVLPLFEIPACAVGGDHIRKRIWFVAYSKGIGWNKVEKSKQNRCSKINMESIRSIWGLQSCLSVSLEWPHNKPNSNILRNDDGVSGGMDRLKGLGNAIVPQVVVPIMAAIKQLTANQ